MRYRALIAALLTAAAVGMGTAPAMAAGLGPSNCSSFSPGREIISQVALAGYNGKGNTPGAFGNPFVASQEGGPACNPTGNPVRSY